MGPFPPLDEAAFGTIIITAIVSAFFSIITAIVTINVTQRYQRKRDEENRMREAKERKKGFIANDLHIPLAQVKNKLDTLDKNKKILVYCRSGARASHIAGLLTRNHFAQVYNLKGGISAWNKANMPIKT